MLRKMSLRESARVVANRRNVSCTVEGEVIILHLDEGVYYGLNQVGARIWELVQQPRTESEVVETLVEEFEVDRARCSADVRELLTELGERNLVRWQSPPSCED